MGRLWRGRISVEMASTVYRLGFSPPDFQRQWDHWFGFHRRVSAPHGHTYLCGSWFFFYNFSTLFNLLIYRALKAFSRHFSEQNRYFRSCILNLSSTGCTAVASCHPKLVSSHRLIVVSALRGGFLRQAGSNCHVDGCEKRPEHRGKGFDHGQCRCESGWHREGHSCWVPCWSATGGKYSCNRVWERPNRRFLIGLYVNHCLIGLYLLYLL